MSAERPDLKLKEQIYRDARPAEHFAVFHERTRTKPPNFVYGVVRVLTSLNGALLFRARGIDAGNVPRTGAVILAPNHASFMDHFFTGMFLRRQIQFMAKSQLFKWPMQAVYSHGGVFPVRRGERDEEAFITANAILARGGAVVMYPEGGRSRTGSIAATAKPGLGRLALESRAAVVPVAIHGSQKVRNWKRAEFSPVTVRYGEALRFDGDPSDRERQQQIADQVLAEIHRLHDSIVDGQLRRERGRGTIRALVQN